MKNTIKKTITRTTAVLVIGLAASMPVNSYAGSDPYIGELMAGGWNFCPRGTARADGALLPISQYSALFSLLGTNFGGDGRTSFALPDLRGRIPMHAGNGPGLPNVRIGQRGGTAQTNITTSQMPSHSHTAKGTAALSNKAGPHGALLGPDSIRPPINKYSRDAAADRIFDASMIANTGGGQPISTQSPYLGITWCIATTGTFPSRN